jgi:glycosyltransferase involved in cell wall biosynthesis
MQAPAEKENKYCFLSSNVQGVSVVICCYNSAERLPLTLQHLGRQKTDPSLQWEVVLVNNNCTDNTEEVAGQIWQSNEIKAPLRIVSEEQPGLSHAREAGVKAAQYEVVVFCDDDNLLSENYLQYAFDLVQKTISSGYSVWGGKTTARFDENTHVPEWFESVKQNYVVGEQAIASGDISDRGYVWGAGMVLIRNYFLKVFDPRHPSLLKDRERESLSSGGDSEICLRLLIIGCKLYYDAQLVLEHYIPENRLNKSYSTALIEGFRNAHVILQKYFIFLHYVGNRNFIKRCYFRIVYCSKYIFSYLRLRKLTVHDTLVLHALFLNNFPDPDFGLMFRLLKLRSREVH